MINEANPVLKAVIQERNIMFIDNDSLSLKDGKPDVSLYKDSMNLNQIGQNIQQALRSTLHVKRRPEQEIK